MVLAKHGDHIELTDVDAASLVALLKGCPQDEDDDPVTLECAALAVWGLARNAHNAQVIGAAGVFPVLVLLLRRWGIEPAVADGDPKLLPRALYVRKHTGKGAGAGDGGWQPDQLRRIGKYEHLLGNLLACVWVLAYCPENGAHIRMDVKLAAPDSDERRVEQSGGGSSGGRGSGSNGDSGRGRGSGGGRGCDRGGGGDGRRGGNGGGVDCILRVINDVLTLPLHAPSVAENHLHRTIMLGLWTTWVFVSTPDTALKMLRLGLAMALFHTSSRAAEYVVGILQAVGRHNTECYMRLNRDAVAIRRAAGAAEAKGGSPGRIKATDLTCIETAIMALVKLRRRPEAQLYGCLALARLVIEEEERVVFRKMGAVEWMIRLSLNPPQDGGTVIEQGVQIAATRALLNLSISPEIQVYLCKNVLYDLLELSWYASLPLETMVNVGAVLSNLTRSVETRTPMYRAGKRERQGEREMGLPLCGSVVLCSTPKLMS
jgi:hypothetical protein